MSDQRSTVFLMPPTDLRDLIETELSDALVYGIATEEALAEAAGLLSDAEERMSRLSIPERPTRRASRRRRKRC
jgi:hypothetical protein